MFEAILFDIDGTLLDTEVLQYQGWVELLKPFQTTLSKEDYIAKYVGGTGTEIEADLIDSLQLDIAKGSLVEEKEKWMIEAIQSSEIPIMDYAFESIDFFVDKGFRVGAVTNAPGEEMRIKLQKTGLIKKFPTTVCRNDVREGKPDPALYLLGAKRLEVNPNKCLAFEDTAIGVQSAKNAGLTCLAIPNEYTKHQDFSGADGVFSNLKESIKWVEKNYQL